VQVVAGSLPVLPDLVLCAARVRVIPFAVTIGKAAGNLTRRHWQTAAALRQDGLVTSLTERVAAVVFDFYGTLTPVHPADRWADQLAALAAIVGVSPGALGVALRESYPERATGALGDLRRRCGRWRAGLAWIWAASGWRQPVSCDGRCSGGCWRCGPRRCR
jgi:hypothetical protein